MQTLLRSGWTLLMLLLASATGWAQAPAWRAVSAINNANTNYSQVQAIAADGNGNLYVAGTYNGPIILGTMGLSYGTGQGSFVAKWNIAANAYVWAQPCGGSVNTLAVSGTNVYIGGVVWSRSAVFGSQTITYGNDNAFVAKLTDNGSSSSFAWVQQLGGGSFAGVQALAVSGSSVYATGAFNTSTASFGSFTLTNTAPGYIALGELYVAKLTDTNTGASVAWVQQVGAGQLGKKGYPRGLAVSGSSVYATGSGGGSAFVAKFTDAGGFGWSKPIGGAQVYPASLAARGDDVYVAGRFLGATATFGSTTLNLTSGSSNFSSDAFVAKLSDTGSDATVGWALRAGGTESDSVTAIVATTTGLYVTGNFSSPTASFGATALANSGSTGYDIFVSRIVENASGASFAWALPAGGAGYDSAQALAVSGSTLYVGGAVQPPATFGTLAVAGVFSSSVVGFLASISDVALAARDPALKASLSLYPNPAHATTTLRVPASAGPATLTLLDALGRPVRTQQAAPNTDITFDLTGLAPGVYALRVQAGEAVATQKLVVE